jgi:hypothetical protein
MGQITAKTDNVCIPKGHIAKITTNYMYRMAVKYNQTYPFQDPSKNCDFWLENVPRGNRALDI